MEIREYKGYRYIVYDNGCIYFNCNLYIYHNTDLEKRIKGIITKTSKENDYYSSREYCNELVEKELRGV